MCTWQDFPRFCQVMLAIEAVTNLSTNANYIKIFNYKPQNSRLNILLQNIQQSRSHLNKFRAKKKAYCGYRFLLKMCSRSTNNSNIILETKYRWIVWVHFTAPQQNSHTTQFYAIYSNKFLPETLLLLCHKIV